MSESLQAGASLAVGGVLQPRNELKNQETVFRTRKRLCSTRICIHYCPVLTTLRGSACSSFANYEFGQPVYAVSYLCDWGSDPKACPKQATA